MRGDREILQYVSFDAVGIVAVEQSTNISNDSVNRPNKDQTIQDCLVEIGLVFHALLDWEGHRAQSEAENRNTNVGSKIFSIRWIKCRFTIIEAIVRN